jgi:RNA polymerase sigma factor (sigma-70 family)
MDKNQTRTDESLIQAICGLPKDREAALYYFYTLPQLHNTVKQYVKSAGGNIADYQDVFQEAFLAFDYNIRHQKFQGNASLQTYFLRIAFNISFKKYKKKPFSIDFEADIPDIETKNIETHIIESELTVGQNKALDSALGKMGEKCKALLLLSGIAQSNEEIAQVMGFSSADMAKKELYRCREKFRNYLHEHPLVKNMLKKVI